MRTVVLRVVALSLLLLLALAGTLAVRTMQRLPDTVLYLVRDAGTTFTLERVYRRTRARTDDPEARARHALAALAVGPTEEEAARGLGSEVPPDIVVRAVRLQDGVLEVDLDGSFAAGGGSASMLGRIHQVTWTLTQSSGIERLALYLDGEPLRVLGGEGVMVAHPWTRPTGDAAVPVW